MFINNENFELASDFEVDILLSDMPIDFMKENIKDQIKSPLSTRTNFLSIMEDKYKMASRIFDEDEDSMNTLITQIREYFIYVLETMDETYNLGIDIDEYQSIDTLMSRTTTLYNYLILRYKKNMCKFIYHYIKTNKKQLVDTFETDVKMKDITTIALKKRVKNKDTVLIISNMPSIIKYILDLEVEALDFVEYSCNNDYYEGTIVTEMLQQGEITSNFVPRYIEVILDEYDSVLDEIQNEVKMKLLSKIK